LSSAKTQVNTLSGQLDAAQSRLTSADGQISALQGKVTALQTQSVDLTQFTNVLLTLGVQEAAAVEAAAETLIPSDSNGPGALEAGVLYFIDRQLYGEYGKNGNMYNKGPYVQPNLTGPITLDGITYTGGSVPSANLNVGYGYQYSVNFRTFWKFGLLALESYSNSAYGGNFESLSATQKAQVLTDLANNKPTSFNEIVPADFFWELFFMVWSGFLMDPMHGGNRGMVGWELVAFNGVNFGDTYGEGLTSQQLMLATTPTRLKPASLSQLQNEPSTIGEG
jgi:gluconate 2-dehydrogenase gamma chain